jgi:transposase
MSIYTRMSRWSKAGVLNRIFTRLQTERLMEVKMHAVSLDSTTVKLHPDGTGARKKTDRSPSVFPAEDGGQAIHLAAANEGLAIAFSLSGAQAGDAPAGRKLLLAMGPVTDGRLLLMDRAYEGDETRALAESLGYTVVVPPKKNRLKPWEYDKEAYKKRNEVERLFRRLKAFRRICTRYDKLDVIFTGFISLALIFEMLRLR